MQAIFVYGPSYAVDYSIIGFFGRDRIPTPTLPTLGIFLFFIKPTAEYSSLF